MLTIMPTTTEKHEWQRMAHQAYANGHLATGHRFSVAATLNDMPIQRFDSLQTDYRAWLCFGEFPEQSESL